MCQEVFYSSFMFCSFLSSASFFHSFFSGSELWQVFLCISCTVVHICVSAGWPTCQLAPPLTVTSTPCPSHLHSSWITERPVRGHGLIVQPKNSPWLSPLRPFHPRSFIGPLQHFLSRVARVLGCVEMTLILTQTQKRENRTARRALYLKEGWIKS